MGKNKKKPMCKFGEKCYRKNPKHQDEFSHPGDDQSDEEEPTTKKVKIAKPDTARDAKKAEAAAALTPSSEEDDDIEEEAKPPAKASQDSDAAAAEEDEDDEDDATPPPSPADVRENIKSKFLVEMPEDFYCFWDLAKSINAKDPCNAFKSSLGVQLVGPYDILAGKSKAKNSQGKRPCYLRHWRYYYDPPEFLTVLRAVDKSGFHMGYFRDDPEEMPAFMASNTATDNGNISARGENIFAAVCWYIDDKIKKDKSVKEALSKLKEKVSAAAGEKKYSLELKTKAMKARDKKVVCKTFHGAGMVVPVDEQEVGYREVPETPADLKKMFKKIADSKTKEERDKHFDPLMEIIMLVQFANDECDYGEGLELGLDMFSYGGDVFNSTILNLMPLAYDLLKRPAFKKTVEVHLKNRRNGCELSELD